MNDDTKKFPMDATEIWMDPAVLRSLLKEREVLRKDVADARDEASMLTRELRDRTEELDQLKRAHAVLWNQRERDVHDLDQLGRLKQAHDVLQEQRERELQHRSDELDQLKQAHAVLRDLYTRTAQALHDTRRTLVAERQAHASREPALDTELDDVCQMLIHVIHTFKTT